MLIKMFQVKGYDAFRGVFTHDNFTHENLSEKVRGQHGIKLLLEVEDSFFLPGIVGVICIGTQVRPRKKYVCLRSDPKLFLWHF